MPPHPNDVILRCRRGDRLFIFPIQAIFMFQVSSPDPQELEKWLQYP
jgi:hypothetical protein